jgi:pimeloyl-ACP methyl ester carboxylesterase/tRNA A37 threonylcarbamoyladenosine dehydratase
MIGDSAEFYESAFDRNIGILTPQEQRSLAERTVTVAGLGGIGGNVVMTLARMGVGRFRIADFDRFEAVNINRQYGANIDTLGQLKCDVIAAELRRVNPHADVNEFPEGFTIENADELLHEADVAVDAVDFYAIETHLAFHRATREHGLFTLMGSPVGFSACVQVFDPHGMSLEEYCGIDAEMDPLEKQLRYATGLVPELAHIDYYDVSAPDSGTDFSAGVGPSLACACGLAASLVAAETVLLLLGRRRPEVVPRTAQLDPYTYRYARTFIPGGMRNYDPAPAMRRLRDRSSLVPQVLDYLYGKPQAQRARVNGVELFHREEGDGEELVLISPLGADSSFWARQLDDLSRSFRVVTYDPRGTGVSSPSRDGCSVEVLTEDLIGLLEHLDLHNVHVLGMALGGLVATRLAAQRPDLVRSLLLASSYAVADDSIRQATQRWRDLSEVATMEEVYEECLEWVFSPAYVRENRLQMDKLKTFFRLTVQDPESFRQHSLAGVHHDARPDLRRVRCPVLVVHGSGDRLVSRDHADDLVASLERARLVVLDDAPHFMSWEQAGRFNREVLTFLGQVATADPAAVDWQRHRAATCRRPDVRVQPELGAQSP